MPTSLSAALVFLNQGYFSYVLDLVIRCTDLRRLEVVFTRAKRKCLRLEKRKDMKQKNVWKSKNKASHTPTMQEKVSIVRFL